MRNNSLGGECFIFYIFQCLAIHFKIIIKTNFPSGDYVGDYSDINIDTNTLMLMLYPRMPKLMRLRYFVLEGGMINKSPINIIMFPCVKDKVCARE